MNTRTTALLVTLIFAHLLSMSRHMSAAIWPPVVCRVTIAGFYNDSYLAINKSECTVPFAWAKGFKATGVEAYDVCKSSQQAQESESKEK